jgi:hypothetical protein
MGGTLSKMNTKNFQRGTGSEWVVHSFRLRSSLEVLSVHLTECTTHYDPVPLWKFLVSILLSVPPIPTRSSLEGPSVPPTECNTH